MNMQRRDFLRGVVAAAGLVVGAGAVVAPAAHAASTRSLDSTESWLLSTGRRALG